MRVQIGNLSVLLGNNFVMDFLILHNFLNVTTADFLYSFFRPILMFFASKMSFSTIDFLKGIFPNPFVFCMRLGARTYVFMVDELRFLFLRHQRTNPFFFTINWTRNITVCFSIEFLEFFISGFVFDP